MVLRTRTFEYVYCNTFYSNLYNFNHKRCILKLLLNPVSVDSMNNIIRRVLATTVQVHIHSIKNQIQTHIGLTKHVVKIHVVTTILSL